jgi:hypothetical protein
MEKAHAHESRVISSSAKPVSNRPLEKLFKLSERNTDAKTEIWPESPLS